MGVEGVEEAGLTRRLCRRRTLTQRNRHNEIKAMAETPDAPRQDQTTHGALLPAEETCPLTDEYLPIQ